MRFSRPCYDKAHRCPGWAGGGTRFAKRQRCKGETGSMWWMYERRAWKWRPTRHPECGVIVLPYMVRWLDWRFWGWKLRGLRRRFADRRPTEPRGGETP